jgi:hypothetical protein
MVDDMGDFDNELKKDGVEKVSKKEWSNFLKIVKTKGWKIEKDWISDMEYIADDSVWYYQYEDPKFDSMDSILFKITKNHKSIYFYVDGEIEIYPVDEHEEPFLFHYGNPGADLTTDLVKYGRWEENNWFELEVEGNVKGLIPDTFISLKSMMRYIEKSL